MRRHLGLLGAVCVFLVPACKGGGGGGDFDFEPGEARAGQLTEKDLPVDERGLAVYEEGDFFLANEHLAIFVEEEGESDLYMPFGGLVVGMADVEFDGDTGDPSLVNPANYNEIALGLRRFLVSAETVSVTNDGTDGEAAALRVVGPFRALPFLEDLIGTPAGDLLLGEPPPTDFDFIVTQVTVDYVLEPDAKVVDIYFTLDNTFEALPVYLFFQSKRMDPYVSGLGFGTGETTSSFPYMAYVGDETLSFAIEKPDEAMVSLFANPLVQELFNSTEISGVMPLTGSGDIAFTAGERVHMMRLHVGGPGIEGLRDAIAETDGDATRTITGTVTNADDSPAAGVRVHAEAAGDGTYLTRSALTGADGTFTLSSLPDGEAVLLTPFRRGDGIPDPIEVDAATSTAELQLPGKGTIRVVATEDDAPIPVRVQVIPDANGFQPPSDFGEPEVPGGDRLHVVFPTNGEVTLPALVGDHRVVVSRGYEYTILDDDISVAEDAETLVEAELERVVDTAGVLCGDFHIHTDRSPDAPDPASFKLMSAAGDGVELPVRTDHEFVAEFESTVASLGLESWMYGLSSTEFTTFSWGHFGVFPLDPDPSLTNDGFIVWNEINDDGTVNVLNPVEVFNEARSRPGDPEIIIFHPKEPPGRGANFSGGAYFEGAPGALGALVNTGGVGMDPFASELTGPEFITGNGKDDFTIEEWWDTDFTAVEVFNDSSFEENILNDQRTDAEDDWGNVDAWFALLNSPDFADGVFAVGSSDSHSVMGGSPVGYPRTCLFTDTDDPASLRDQEDAPQAIKALVTTGQSVISGGFYVTAEGPGGVAPGGTVSGAGPHTFTITVQAPVWVPNLTRVEMWYGDDATVNQMTIAVCEETSLPGTCVDSGGGIDNASITRLSRSDVMVPAGADWVVFHARGPFEINEDNQSDPDRTLAPVHPRRLPFGVTNPVFFE